MTLPIAANGDLYNQAQCEEFLAMLYRYVDWQPGQQISLLGIGEKGTTQEGAFKAREFVPPGFIGVAHGHLKRWAQWHVAGFIVPAVLTAEASTAKGGGALDKVAALTAIILDIDSGDVNAKAKYVIDRLGKPTMMVASGGKTEAGTPKGHLYWRLSEPSEEVERVAALRKLLAAKVGGDQSFGRATQVIRVPGSVHAKNGNASVCAIAQRNDVDYDLEDLADIIENMEPMPGLPVVEPKEALPFTAGGLMDFTPRQDTAIAALHRDVHEGGEELTRWSEFSKVAGFNIAEIRAGRLTPEAAYNACFGWMLSHMVPAWPQARFDDEFRGLLNKDVENHGPFPQSVTVRHEAVTTTLEPTPAAWPLAQSIKPRPWLFGKWLQRGIVTAIIAPGGIGKSSLVTAMTLSMASGKEILGKSIYGGPLTPWYWNLEDSGDNLARARIGAAIHHGIREEDCGGRMFVDSGPDGASLCTATEDRNGFVIIEPVFANIVAALIARGIDALFVDPFVSSHAVSENDNTRIDAIAKAWSRVAQAANCAIVLVHHSRKMNGEAVTADSARGAGALNNAARMTLVLNRMSEEQAETWGLEPYTHQQYFSVADDKHNLSAAEAADWFRIVGQSLNNADGPYEADNIGVVVPFKAPRVMDGVMATDLFAIQRVLHSGTYWRNSQAKDWAGNVVANVLGLDAVEAKSKKRINSMIETWLKSGALKIEVRRNEKSMNKECVVVGHWAGDPNAYANLAAAERNVSEIAPEENQHGR